MSLLVKGRKCIEVCRDEGSHQALKEGPCCTSRFGASSGEYSTALVTRMVERMAAVLCAAAESRCYSMPLPLLALPFAARTMSYAWHNLAADSSFELCATRFVGLGSLPGLHESSIASSVTVAVRCTVSPSLAGESILG